MEFCVCEGNKMHCHSGLYVCSTGWRDDKSNIYLYFEKFKINYHSHDEFS